MKKKLHFYLVLLLAPVTAFLAISFSNGPSAGLTGSPGDSNNNCTVCHSGADTNTAFGLATSITTNIPSGGYALGQTYTITVTQTSFGSATKHGFEITAEIANASKVGTFVITDATDTQIRGTANDFVTHTSAGSDQTSWSFNWTAPSFDAGNVTFYVASIAGGGTGATNSQMELITKPFGVLGLNDARLLQFTMYPNPSVKDVSFQLPSNTNQAQVTVFDYLGKSLLQKNISTSNNNIDVSKLSTGIYFVRIQTASKVGTKKLIVR